MTSVPLAADTTSDGDDSSLQKQSYTLMMRQEMAHIYSAHAMLTSLHAPAQEVVTGLST